MTRWMLVLVVLVGVLGGCNKTPELVQLCVEQCADPDLPTCKAKDARFDSDSFMGEPDFGDSPTPASETVLEDKVKIAVEMKRCSESGSRGLTGAEIEILDTLCMEGARQTGTLSRACAPSVSQCTKECNRSYRELRRVSEVRKALHLTEMTGMPSPESFPSEIKVNLEGND
jgi:hypothetical protein